MYKFERSIPFNPQKMKGWFVLCDIEKERNYLRRRAVAVTKELHPEVGATYK